MGFVSATPIQKRAIPIILNHKDLIGCAQTGTGKTAAFLIPILEKLHNSNKKGIKVCVIVPTRELAQQIDENITALSYFLSVSAISIFGGNQPELFAQQKNALQEGVDVVIATPGRLIAHMNLGYVDFSTLDILILDEADRMLEMGFIADINKIIEDMPKKRQTLLFSATLSHKGMPGITRMLRDPESITIDEHRQGHDSITQQVVLADDVKHKEKLVIALLAKEQAPRSMVFCNTRKGCQELGTALKVQKLRVDYIHGELSQSDRKQVMNRFRSGQIGILVATDVAARGLDIEGITLVINFNVAQSGDDHVHRIGRTGRAGQVGKAITLVSSNEWNPMSSIERYLKLRFEHRKVPGLQASYRGPVKVKKSGKAAGSKKTKARRSQKKTAQPKKSGGEIGYKPLKR